MSTVKSLRVKLVQGKFRCHDLSHHLYWSQSGSVLLKCVVIVLCKSGTLPAVGCLAVFVALPTYRLSALEIHNVRTFITLLDTCFPLLLTLLWEFDGRQFEAG